MRGKHDFSLRLEATKKDGVQTGQTPRPNAPRPPHLHCAHKPVGDQ